jgi:hypothetical protein
MILMMIPEMPKTTLILKTRTIKLKVRNKKLVQSDQHLLTLIRGKTKNFNHKVKEEIDNMSLKQLFLKKDKTEIPTIMKVAKLELKKESKEIMVRDSVNKIPTQMMMMMTFKLLETLKRERESNSNRMMIALMKMKHKILEVEMSKEVVIEGEATTEKEEVLPEEDKHQMNE